MRVKLESSDSRVIPDLSASADVHTGKPSNGLIVPREALSEAEGKTIVYVKQGDTFQAHEVEISTATNTQVALISGIEEGQEVALQPPYPVIH